MAIKTDVSQLDRFAIKLKVGGEKTPERIKIALTRIGIYLTGYVKEHKLSGSPINRRSGRLSRSISSVVQGEGQKQEVVIGQVRGDVDAPYGWYLEHGAKPHVIRPVKKKALKFMRGSEAVIVRSVNHPGNKPFYFMRNSLKENVPFIREQLSKASNPVKK